MAIDAIAADLESSPRIDYQRRRQALATWTLPPAAWTHMVDQLDIQPGNRAIVDDRKRLAVSAYIWAHVTQSEHHHSPCPPDILSDPGTLNRWRRQRAETARWLSQTDEHPFYRDLKSLLDDYANQLADALSQNRTLPREALATTSLPSRDGPGPRRPDGTAERRRTTASWTGVQ
jgi:hypothetical protein